MRTKDITATALFTALIAVMSQISVPMPLGVPLTLQTFAIPLAGIVLGAKRATVATLLYLGMGAIGLPVFAGFGGGIGSLFGPTGGFLFSFPLLALFAGLGSERGNACGMAVGLALGTAANYAVGTAFFAVTQGQTIVAALSACVIPFLPTAVLKAAAAGFAGVKLKAMLRRAGFGMA
jgi:biotin transport system substrate-specific component